jgi:hypothetical protein
MTYTLQMAKGMTSETKQTASRQWLCLYVHGNCVINVSSARREVRLNNHTMTNVTRLGLIGS